jgi:hypothetical protein
METSRIDNQERQVSPKNRRCEMKKMYSPIRLAYVLSALVVVLGCIAASIIFGNAASSLPDQFKNAYDVGWIQVLVPGSAELELSRIGVYGIYYEYRSVMDGVEYVGSEIPPALTCTLTSNSTGQEIQAAPDYVETNRYSTYRDERIGVLAMSFSISDPDTYLFSCEYADGSTEPPVVLAVGRNIVWELFNIVAGTADSALRGIAALCGSAMVALVIVGVGAFARRWAHRPVSSQAPLQPT